ncbi:MAG: peptidyl-prolyl cis-trans isomerase [Candidatus Schekmanbacteria bacterium]|nr:peptidyl-prolyl cis-trans isomerase [Candidatus Schekmanbacteria bacterium]
MEHNSPRGYAVLSTAGAIIAAVGLYVAPAAPPARPAGAVAFVNGAPILRGEYDRAVAAVAEDVGHPLPEASRRRVLGRLIEEQLLIQRALDLGLPVKDRRVRSALSGAMIQTIIDSAKTTFNSSEDALRSFYETHSAYFAPPRRIQVEAFFFRAVPGGSAALTRAEEARSLLADGAAAAEVAALADASPAPPPATSLSPAQLAAYLGAPATAEILRLAAGEVSPPLLVAGGLEVVRVVSRETDSPPAFSEMVAVVSAEARKRHADDALRAYLDDLRAEARVELVDEP